ncbi:MAG: methyltransferase domain-containing protein [Candidatus Ozemobacteraceae bacterium]
MKKVTGEHCLVCEKRSESLFSFPKMPFTGNFAEIFSPHFPTHDQEFLFCNSCGHGQLKHFIDPSFLYGSTYGFRTSKSHTASAGAMVFVRFLKKLFPNQKFSRILEFGCNDGFLLKLLEDDGEILIGVDSSMKTEQVSPKIKIIEGKIEEIDFQSEFGGQPDLIISQHTLEHIENPKELLRNLFSKVTEKTTFLFEFPCLDSLFEKNRFDQIFHQHLHYFSLHSFLKMLHQIGGELLDYSFNFNYWGALLVAFRKKSSNKLNSRAISSPPFPDYHKMQKGYALFKNQMEITNILLEQLNGEKNIVFGYGAALMLPILGYHLNTDFSFLKGIFDDDQEKTGNWYINLPLQIQDPQNQIFEDLAILLTAMDNRRPILKKLVDLKPRMIINPLIIC